MWKNKYNRDDYSRIESPCGSGMAVSTGWSIDKTGNQVFTVKKTYSLYERIQAARDSVDLQALLKRYECGDKTALDRVQATYFDLVDMPTNYAEMFNAVSNCTSIFNDMPVDIKEKYNNNPAKFWAEAGTSKFDDVINTYRSDILVRHAMIDSNPLSTSDSVKPDISVDSPITPIDKEVK